LDGFSGPRAGQCILLRFGAGAAGTQDAPSGVQGASTIKGPQPAQTTTSTATVTSGGSFHHIPIPYQHHMGRERRVGSGWIFTAGVDEGIQFSKASSLHQ